MGQRTKDGTPRTREDSDQGVHECLALMTSGQWVTGKSHRELAERHDVHPDTVKKWATSASRIIRIALEGDVEDIRARMVSTLEGIIADARTGADHRAAVAAVEAQAKLMGLVVQRVEVAMTEAEAEALVAAVKALP